MRTLEDLGEYQRKFLKIARILINDQKLSDLDRDALFLSGLPADLETQVHQRLLITKSTHHPSNPYSIADIVEATQFLLTGSALCPLLAAPAAGTPTAQPYYPAWAAPVPAPVALRTATPTAAAAVKQEQINLQCTARRDCAFCADPSHFMGSCPLVEGYIQAGKASRGTNGRLYLPDSRHMPCVQGTRCLRECLDRLPALAPALSLLAYSRSPTQLPTPFKTSNLRSSWLLLIWIRTKSRTLLWLIWIFRRTSPTLGPLSRPIGRTKGSESDSMALRCRLERPVVQILGLHRWPRKSSRQ